MSLTQIFEISLLVSLLALFPWVWLVKLLTVSISYLDELTQR